MPLKIGGPSSCTGALGEPGTSAVGVFTAKTYPLLWRLTFRRHAPRCIAAPHRSAPAARRCAFFGVVAQASVEEREGAVAGLAQFALRRGHGISAQGGSARDLEQRFWIDTSSAATICGSPATASGSSASASASAASAFSSPRRKRARSAGLASMVRTKVGPCSMSCGKPSSIAAKHSRWKTEVMVSPALRSRTKRRCAAMTVPSRSPLSSRSREPPRNRSRSLRPWA